MSTDERGDVFAEAARWSLAELVGAADVSVRTVRYYIGEGLLPPPAGAGPGSSYGQAHLDRLRLIQRLKAAYLPLKEIRRRLAGLSDDDVRALLVSAEERMPATTDDAMSYDASLAGAREYLALLESGARYHTEPMELPLSSSVGAAASPLPADARRDRAPAAARSRGPRAAGVVAAAGDLDLDDVGPEVAEHHGAVRPDHDAGQIDHPHPVQRPPRPLLAHPIGPRGRPRHHSPSPPGIPAFRVGRIYQRSDIDSDTSYC